MTIERFSKEQFEAALPVHKDTGDAIWYYTGLDAKEHTYQINVKPGVAIQIRSSVQSDGFAAETGSDSIRAWLVNENGAPLGSKVISYTTRQPGWADRMTKVLRKLFATGQKIQQCPYCGKLMGIFKVKKDGPNKGRQFSKCWDHGNTFYWLDEQEAPTPPPKKKQTIFPYAQDDVVKTLATSRTIKGRVGMLKNDLAEDADLAVWALLYIYSFQTASEQAVGDTYEDNGVGFSGVDAEILSSFAEQWKKRESLSPKQLEILHKKMGKYAKQIEKSLRIFIEVHRELMDEQVAA